MGRRIRASLVVAAARFDPRSQETSTGAGGRYLTGLFPICRSESFWRKLHRRCDFGSVNFLFELLIPWLQ
jgi:hypothetical protein